MFSTIITMTNNALLSPLIKAASKDKSCLNRGLFYRDRKGILFHYNVSTTLNNIST